MTDSKAFNVDSDANVTSPDIAAATDATQFSFAQLPSDGDACGWNPNDPAVAVDPNLPPLTRMPWHHEVAAKQSDTAATSPATPAVAATPAHPSTQLTLADLTTTGIGGPIANFERINSEADFIAAIESADRDLDTADRDLDTADIAPADRAPANSETGAQRLLVIGGGSNILAGDAPFTGLVLQDQRSEIKRDEESACGGVTVEVSAGTPWDELVATSIENGWMGLEALSGIPGTVGAAPVQNIGAYGQEVAETISMVTVYDRARKRRRMLALADLKFGYRDSLLKRSLLEGVWGPSPRYIVLSVQFQFRHATLSAPIRYKELARRLGVEVGDRVDARRVREAVLELRKGKGMVLDPSDRDTYSTGSFFTNPIIPVEQADALPEQAPRFPVHDHWLAHNIGDEGPLIPGVVKTSAAWLISRAGFEKGFHLNDRCALSSKHVLAITNQGGASAADIAQLARTVRDGVAEKFGIRLEPEPVTVGFEL